MDATRIAAGRLNTNTYLIREVLLMYADILNGFLMQYMAVGYSRGVSNTLKFRRHF